VAEDAPTRDGESVRVNALGRMRVVDPAQAIVQAENFVFATTAALRAVIRQQVAERDRIEVLEQRQDLQALVEKRTNEAVADWGVEIDSLALRPVD
jgi:regulator of protease activity HflC (stomatin/prohibitin superfamily)